MIGKMLGHYQITQRFGECGMRVVYKARDLHLDRFVPPKIFPPGWQMPPAWLRKEIRNGQ